MSNRPEENSRPSRGFIAQLRAYGPFRDPDGLFFGVAKGLAEHFGWSTGLVRLVLVLSAIFLFFWPTCALYLAAAILMSPAPRDGLDRQEERDLWLQVQLDPAAALEGLERRSQAVEKRVRRLEDYVTSRDFSWTRRLKT